MTGVPFICTVRILILHQHFKFPQGGGAIRSYYLAKALVEQGHRAVVITTHNEEKYRQENLEGIEVHYLPVAYDNRFQFYARSWSFVRYIFGAIGLAAKFKDFDCCYAISVPLTIGIAAIRIQSRYGMPYVFEVGDLWPEAPVQMGYVKNYFLKRALYLLEEFIYKRASAIVALSPSIKEYIDQKAPGRLVVNIPNMGDTDFYKPEPKLADLERKFGVAGKFVVSYTGALGVANGLDYYLECARGSQKAGLPVHFILCGDGAMLDHLKKAVEQLQLNNLSIIPFQNRDGVREIMNVTDASFICYKPVPVLETGSPNKFFDALAAGKMIIINFRGWIKSEIEHYHCGIYVDASRPSEFVSKISTVLASKAELERMQKGSRQLAELKYSRQDLSKQFIDVLLRSHKISR